MSFLADWWRKTRSMWPQPLRQHVTRAGLVYSGTLLVVMLAAFLSANNLLFLIMAAMLSALFVSGLVSRLSIAGLELDLSLPDHISARRKTRASLRLRNLKRWIPSFSIHLKGAPESGFQAHLYFPVIPGGAAVEESVELYFPKRGKQRERSFQFFTRFPFGFAERRELVTARHDILIYPCLDPQPGFDALLAAVSGEMEAQQRGRGQDFYRVRPYEALESARHVDWKATAHTGNLQIREFAREKIHQVSIYLDLDTPQQDEEWFESAVDCCAFLAYRLTEAGARVRFRTQELDFTIPDDGDIYAVLRYLALVSIAAGKMPGSPDSPVDFQIVFTANPARMTALGWGGTGSRFVGTDTMPPADTDIRAEA